jgi:thiol-disulfide isomerase/thioredoxin
MRKKILYFGGADCALCHVKRPVVAQVAQQYGVPVEYRDIADPAQLELCRAFGFRRIPALVLLTDPEDGGLEQRLYGAFGDMINAPALESRLRG